MSSVPSFLRPFIPVTYYAVLTFLMLAAWIDYSGAVSNLCPLLYLARLIAWVVALLVVAVLFFPLLRRSRMGMLSTILLSTIAILIHYACFGFLTANAEERVIRYGREHRNPSDDIGPTWLYTEFSGAGYSRGAYDAAEMTWTELTNGLVLAVLWFPCIFLASRALYRTPSSNPSNPQRIYIDPKLEKPVAGHETKP